MFEGARRRMGDRQNVCPIIRAFLKAGLTEEGLVSPVYERTPQGGSHCPLSSNLVLGELDNKHSEQTGQPARRFKDFTWSTLDSWSRTRRVIGKAEWTGGEANPRFVVTSLARSEHEARHLYEKVYCARGDMENRIKECQLDLFADRTSATTMRANQLRLWFAAMAYVLVCALRRVALRHTQFAEATCGTIRLKLFKIGALVRVSVRRIKIAMASACPYQNEFALAHLRLTATAH